MPSQGGFTGVLMPMDAPHDSPADRPHHQAESRPAQHQGQTDHQGLRHRLWNDGQRKRIQDGVAAAVAQIRKIYFPGPVCRTVVKRPQRLIRPIRPGQHRSIPAGDILNGSAAGVGQGDVHARGLGPKSIHAHARQIHQRHQRPVRRHQISVKTSVVASGNIQSHRDAQHLLAGVGCRKGPGRHHPHRIPGRNCHPGRKGLAHVQDGLRPSRRQQKHGC